MAKCAYCENETQLYNGGVPICVVCADKREGKRKLPNTDQIRTALVSRIAQTTARVSAANQVFNEAIGQTPTGLPHPDGVQRIKNASNDLNFARSQMMDAHKRLTDFIERGVVPADLKG
jgi:hypothetical protein